MAWSVPVVPRGAIENVRGCPCPSTTDFLIQTMIGFVVGV